MHSEPSQFAFHVANSHSMTTADTQCTLTHCNHHIWGCSAHTLGGGRRGGGVTQAAQDEQMALISSCTNNTLQVRKTHRNGEEGVQA